MCILRAGGKLSTISNLYRDLDDEFKKELDREGNGRCFFQLLKLPQADHLYPVLEALLSFYSTEEKVFKFGDIRMSVTLEDVLYITCLPIRGKAVICEDSRDLDAFSKLFGHSGKQMTMARLKAIAIDQTLSKVKRKIAVLLILFSSVVIPRDDIDVPTTYVQFFYDLEDVNSYAWGAALLAFLYTGLDGYFAEGERSIRGNMWILLSFFLIRIPKLSTIIGVDFQLEPFSPLLGSIVSQVQSVSYNHQTKYVNTLKGMLANLSEADIIWTPYDPSWLPLSIKDNAKYGTLLAHIFCNNNVAIHKPHFVAKQFRALEGQRVSHGRLEGMKIVIKKNKGPKKQNFKGYYMDALAIWNEQKCAEDFKTPISPSRVHASTSSPGARNEEELGDGRSRLKRACREYDIGRWPGNKKQARNNDSLFERESVQDPQQDMRPSSSSKNPSLKQNLPHTNMENTQHLIVEEEAEKVIIRVKYGEDTVKFDEDNEEILISCDDDLQLCPKSQTATGKTCIQLFVPT